MAPSNHGFIADMNHAMHHGATKEKRLDIHHAMHYVLVCCGNNAFTSIPLTFSAKGTAGLFAPTRLPALRQRPACSGCRTTVA
jgi:hypothetical protein